jgi:hypothetical protein
MTLPTNDSIKQISDLAKKQVDILNRIDEAEERLKELNEMLKQVSEVDLPTAMFEAGVSSFTLDNGMKVSTKEDVYASIPKGKEDEAFGWLNSNGFGGIIKHVVSASFAKEEDEIAKELISKARAMGLNPEDKRSVHSATLKAFVKEQLAQGKNIPLETFGAFQVTKATVK